MTPELPTIKKLIFEQEECVINENGKSEIKWVKFAECPSPEGLKHLAHPAAGLQFSGEPTERALEARMAINRLKNCYSFGRVDMYIGYEFLCDFDDLILDALQLMAEERR